MIYYIRWLAVIPGGVVCAMLVTFPIHWLIVISGEAGIIATLPPEDLEYFAYAFTSPFTTIVAGSYIAPAFRLQTSQVLSAIIFMIYAYFIFVSDVNFIYTGFHLAASVGLSVSGIIVALFTVHKYSLHW